MSVSISCPDCGGLTGDGEPGHPISCPVCRHMDAAALADVEFFAKYPNARHYRRRLLPGDLGVQSLKHVECDGLVLVEQIRPAVFHRTYPRFWPIANADGSLTADAATAAGLPQPLEKVTDVSFLALQESR